MNDLKIKYQVVKVSPGGSHLGASWSEGSKPNVILGFRVPTTIGLRKPPAHRPCSHLAPLAPRASLGPWSELGASWSEPNVILGPWVPGTFLEPQEVPSLLPLLPVHSPCSQSIPGSLERAGSELERAKCYTRSLDPWNLPGASGSP